MLHLSSILLGTVMFLCTLFVPTVNTADVHTNEKVYYYDTYYTAENSESSQFWFDIPYISKTLTSSYYQTISCPSYTYAPAVGSCAAVAAGNLIGYYDRFDENLIPDHLSGKTIYDTDIFIYNIEDSNVKQTIETLYQYITGDGYGATEDDFKRGVTQFCTEKGKHIQFYSCMSNGSFNFGKAQNYIEAGYPVVLFLGGYNVCDIFTYDNEDSVDCLTSTANHIMVGFGYETYTYVTNNGTENYDYIYVASGTFYNPSGLFNIHYNTTINDVLAVNIY